MTAAAGVHLASVVAQQGETNLGRHLFHEYWERRERQIENGWVRHLALRVKSTLYPSGTITLDLNEIGRDLRGDQRLYRIVEAQLHDSLIDYAETSTRGHKLTVEAQARRIGMKSATFKAWKTQRDRRRTPSR